MGYHYAGRQKGSGSLIRGYEPFSPPRGRNIDSSPNRLAVRFIQVASS